MPSLLWYRHSGSCSLFKCINKCQETTIWCRQVPPTTFGSKKHLCPNLHIDSWGLKKSDEAETGLENLDDVHLGQYKIEGVEEEKYLGDIISSDGSNMKNVVARKTSLLESSNKLVKF